MQEFKEEELKKLFRPAPNSTKEDNGKVTIIGGSSLFHGAPILALKTVSRVVEMVFFASPEPSVGRVAEEFKSKLSSFIWVPWEEVGRYIKKSDAVLIGPGLMRYQKEGEKEFDEAGEETKRITEEILSQFSEKQWVIDAGSLQVMDPKYISKNAILTPNQKEFEILFGSEISRSDMNLLLGFVMASRRIGGSPSDSETQKSSCVPGSSGLPGETCAKIISSLAEKYHCVIVLKTPETLVCSPKECVLIKDGNAGLTKGGTGDVLAGLTVALAAKNPPFLAACAASWITKRTADELYKKVGFAYNADDLAEKIPEVLGEYLY